MSEAVIRKIQASDLPALRRLWAETYGDPEEQIDAFFRLLPGMGTGLAAVEAGRVLGAAYAITGLELFSAEGQKRPFGYLYAVAVDEAARHRGLGRALSRACADEAKALGCAFFCTQPAAESLFAWYEEILGMRCALRRREETVPAAALEPGMELSPTDYRFWRERLLTSLPHIRLGDGALLFQHSLCKSYGGGFFAVGDAVAAAYLDEGRCVIRELLCPEGTDRRALAASLAAHLGVGEALLCTPDPAGAPYIAAVAGALPADCIWTLSFD